MPGKNESDTSQSDGKNKSKQRIVCAMIIIFVICVLFGSGCLCFNKYSGPESSIRWINPRNWERRAPIAHIDNTQSEYSERCKKCGVDNPHNMCDDCDSCDTCKIEDKCGSCQKFELQTSLSENQKPCVLCNKKPCKCCTKTGKSIIKEPGVSRNGIYSSGLSNMVYI